MFGRQTVVERFGFVESPFDSTVLFIELCANEVDLDGERVIENRSA